MNTRRKTLLLVAGLAIVAVAALFAKRSEVYLLTLTCVYLMATFGLNLTVGYAGQMSLGQAAFFGIGAYHAAIVLKMGWPIFVVLPIAGDRVLCHRSGPGLPGAARPAPLPRVRDTGLQRPRVPRHAQRGEDHRRHVRHLRHSAAVAVRRTTLSGAVPFFYFTFVSLIILAALLWWLLRSPWGRAFAALRDNPIRAESLGVNITAYTLLAFAIGAACAGIGGVYYASLVEFIEPGPFHFSTSLMMLLAVIVGGSGRFMGPVVGTIIIILLPEFLRSSNVEWLKFMQKWYLAFFGVAVIALMIWLPGGILSFGDRFKAKGAAK